MKTKTKPLRALFAGLASAVLLCAGCMTSDPDRLHKKAAVWVPIGTPVEGAKRIMEGHGFRCEQSRFQAARPWAGPILRCIRVNHVLNRTWIVNLFLENERVAGSDEFISTNPLRIQPSS